MIHKHDVAEILGEIIKGERTLRQLVGVFFDSANSFLEALFEATKDIPVEDVMSVLDKLFF